MNEQEKFLSDLDIKTDDILDKPLTEEPEVETPKEETEEETEQKAKNRRERRLLEKNQQLREEAIAASARLQALTEAQATMKDTEADYLKGVEQIYGNATPEAQAATELFKHGLKGAEESAFKRALEAFRNERASEAEEVRKEEANLDDILDKVEDEHGIDMDGEDRKGFLSLLEKLSPKDRDGNIIEYADPDTTAEIYLSRKERPNVRAKELASRSMTRSGASSESKIEESAAIRFLRENDII